jgi:murein DD-endopeptidase MepM/ murein hydrolase activator NlpD
MSSRRPSGPATSRRPGSRRPVATRPFRAILAGAVTAVVLLATAAPALAAPPPPPNPSDSQLGTAKSEQDAAAAEVGRIAGLVAGAEAELEKVEVQAEAAGTAYEQAQEALQQAQDRAAQTAADLQTAAAAVAAAEARIATFSHNSYMNGSNLSTASALLDSAGPGELIQRAAILDYVASNQVDVLSALEVAKVAQANADASARAARDAMAAAEEAAHSAKAKADAQLAAQQGAYDQVSAQKASYDQQLQAAQIHLLELQGARNAYDQWVSQKAAEEAAARAAAEKAARDAAAAAAGRGNVSSGGGGGGGGGGDYVQPAFGRVSSCFGARWGVTHFGVDIANSIGTPIYAAAAGVVKRAGPATGFGLAVYILGDDGFVTVYGHVNRYFVTDGEHVSAGEQIAEIGNRGQSTGPHLHFEVHSGGQLYSNQLNPVPWLNARGIFIGGCGG